MKKLTNFFIILVFLSGLSLTAGINVTSPVAGSEWHKGDDLTISWTSIRCTDPGIKINIFRNSISVANFIEQLTCSGCSSKSWTIPTGYATGNYIIRVKTADDTCIGDSGIFTISEPPSGSAEYISVSNPTSSTSFYVTKWALSISWETSSELADNLKIEVIPEGNPAGAMIVIPSAPNIGEYNWLNPGVLTGAGRFFIRVKTLDGTVWGDSEVYQVNEHAVTAPSLNIRDPHSETVWNVNTGRMIGWFKSGEMDSHVRLAIHSETGTLTYNISDRTENDENHGFTLPAAHPAGRHFVRITTVDGLVTDDSEVFQITRPDDSADPSSAPGGETIIVKFPNSRSTWRSGQKAEIVWSRKPSMHRRVKIELFKERYLGVKTVISANTENDGNFVWKIPTPMSSGKYVIKVTTLDRTDYGVSKIFTINSRLSGLRKVR